MSIAADLLKAHHIGIRDFKEHLSTKFLNEILVVTDRGIPISVNLPYSDIVELIDILDEIRDLETLTTVRKGRYAIIKGTKGINVSKLFNKIRARRG